MLVRPSQESERGQRNVEGAVDRDRSRADVEAGAFERDAPRLLNRVRIRLHEELRDPFVAIAHAVSVYLEGVAELHPASMFDRHDEHIGAKVPDSGLAEDSLLVVLLRDHGRDVALVLLEVVSRRREHRLEPGRLSPARQRREAGGDAEYERGGETLSRHFVTAP